MKKQQKSISHYISLSSPIFGISIGLKASDDIELRTWSVLIGGYSLNSRKYQNIDFSLEMECSDKYPDEPPHVKFNTRVNLDIVDGSMNVIPSKIETLRNWKREYTMEKIAVEIKNIIEKS